MTLKEKPEPWLRGTLSDVPAVARAVLHALQLAEEDLVKWCGEMSQHELNLKAGTVASVAFQIRHLARSVDRLLTYAEGRQLNDAQLTALRTESDGNAARIELFAELRETSARAEARIRALATANLEEPRSVGRRSLPTTVGGLLVHVAEHTQRHVGQAITTAKMVRGLKDNSEQ